MRRFLLCAGSMLAGCLFPSLGSLTGGGSDATADAPSDAGLDAFVPGPVVIAQTGSVGTASGNAQQTHIVWMRGVKAWWLFYIDDDTMSLKSRWSHDWQTWNDGATLTLPYTHGSEGRNYDVGYAFLGGVDVVHMTMSHVVSATKLERTHTRGTVVGDVITWGPVVDASNPTTDFSDVLLDVPSSRVGPTGTVYDVSGWVDYYSDAGVGNANAFIGQHADDGTAWTFGFTEENVEEVPNYVHGREALAPATSCSPLYFYDNADQQPDPSNVRASCLESGWSAPADLFPSGNTQSANDWCAAWLPGEMQAHVVRATLAGDYGAAVFASGMANGANAPPALARQARSGLVLVTDGVGMSLVDLGMDLGVHRVRYTSGAWAAAWDVVDATAKPRSYLSGSSVDAADATQSGGSAIIWTETAASGYEIAGVLIQP